MQMRRSPCCDESARVCTAARYHILILCWIGRETGNSAEGGWGVEGKQKEERK